MKFFLAALAVAFATSASALLLNAADNVVAQTVVAQTVAAQNAPRVYAADATPDDWRLGDLKDLNGYFPMQKPASKQAWTKRAEEVRRRILVACGLWPMPPRPAVNATIHGLVDRPEYTVERVFFESYPGFYVTGSLYRPKARTGPRPVVLSPHGHFTEGRFHDHGREELVNQIKQGAERFEIGGRHPLQARCVHLARMGCVVFHYDMIGYADSQQLSYELTHRHAQPRPAMENSERWGLFTAQAEMRLQNVFGLQTFNGLRAVDFVIGLPDVDSRRIAVTGASGGGTQTMILAALEPRVAVSFPAVMVSTAMQGGCTCENAACLRVGTGNIEFAGLFAPRPQGISYANDWTKELLTKGMPRLKELYKLYDAENLVQADWNTGGRSIDLTYFQHNFNAVCRDKMYDWMNEHLQLGNEPGFLERDYVPLSVDEMTVWNDDHPKPPQGDAFETKFLRNLSDASDDQLKAAANSPQEFGSIVRPALTTLLATDYDQIGEVTRENIEKSDMGDYWQFKDKIRVHASTDRQTELPVLFFHPKQWNNEVVIWASGLGKAGLWNQEENRLRDEAQKLLAQGYSIVCPDLFQQGEFLSDGPLKQTRKVANNRDFAGYTFGYNSTLIGHRVHDLLSIVKFVHNDNHGTNRVHIVGVEGAGPFATLASVLAGNHVDKVAIDDGDFRFRDIQSWRDPNFLPGAIKYGDLPAMLGLVQSAKLWIGTKDVETAKAAMQPFRNLDGKPEFQLTENAVAEAIDWLVQ